MGMREIYIIFAVFFALLLLILIAGYRIRKRIQAYTVLLAEKERELALANTEKMRANLLRAVSHDLRTPLTGIIGNCLTYLENGTYLSEEEKRKLVQNVYDDSTWLINMTENLLMVTRIKDSNLSIKKTAEPVEEVVGSALAKLQSRHKGCVINATVPEDLILLPMDPILIEQVLINLAENALFHSGSDKPVELVVTNDTDSVSFTVKDYGCGIPAEKLDSLFDGSGYNAISDAHKGMGVGLVICKTIISAHEGEIRGYNHAEGAAFTFTLPKKA